jgi:hypothetical protein
MKLPVMHQIKLYPIEVRIYNRVQLVGESQGLDRSFDKVGVITCVKVKDYCGLTSLFLHVSEEGSLIQSLKSTSLPLICWL